MASCLWRIFGHANEVGAGSLDWRRRIDAICAFQNSAEDGVLDGSKCVRMTSNQFLGTIGEPTMVEGEVGRVYERAGLGAAFSWIEENLVPMFERQEENRIRRAGLRRS